jgi:hypothetical protein
MASKNGRVRATGNEASASATRPRLRFSTALSISIVSTALATSVCSAGVSLVWR